MTYEEYKLEIEQLNERMNAASKCLQAFPTGEMGLTPDSVKKTEEYQKAKHEYEKWFNLVRKCNAEAPVSYKRKRQQERRNEWCK